MNFCTNCGAELGLGRFCTNCGAPVSGDLPTDFPDGTAVRPPLPTEGTAARPIAPPDASAGSRYPLYADQAVLSVVAAKMAPVPPPRRHASADRSWVLPIVLLVVAMLAAATAGIWLATRDSGTSGDPLTAPSSGPISGTPSKPTHEPSTVEGDQSNLAPQAEVDAPPSLPPGLDLANNRVSYAAPNMLDENPETAYRVAGDATGSVITFRLPETSTITEVGLVNGYAKTDTRGGRSIDWYAKNRRIIQVEWRFDDGTSVVQDLESTREMQLLEIDPEKTGTVELRIVEVSAPGRPPLSKNVTAISDVLLLGS
jgi:hypothetical protein